jgi:acetyl-CoA/propionyl-CoA carboxylase biotin carboxyl carrier protein
VFDTVLIANRGEIAVRVIRTLRALGVRSVAVFSDADAHARHVAEADVAVRIGPAAAAHSYLSIPAVLQAATAAGAQAIHPGYGFLSENTAFAAACADAGIAFVGPPAAAIEAMGDKIRAKRTVAAAGVPVVPGSDGAGLDDDALAAAVADVGFPVLLKPSAGGGGKGMREVHDPADLRAAITSARREARGSFGDDTLLVERLVTNPRHIEIQVVADAHGHVVHLGERECSLQRRHQKIVEEAPSALLTPAQRAQMGAAAVDAARAVGYVGAGTVEFIVDPDQLARGDAEGFFFMEMNTRLQVEHPVTEMVTGLDLVELQLRVAAGEPLPITQDEVVLRGHAVEARVYAEDPAAGFLPTGGRILALREPAGPGIRVDSGVVQGGVVGSDYDPMLAKVVAHGADRAEALRRLDAALARTVLLGLGTNIGFLRELLGDDDVRAARLDTGLVARKAGQWAAPDLPDDVLAAAATHALLALEPAGPLVDPFDVPGGWRVGEPAWTRWRMLAAGHPPVEVRTRGRARDAEVIVGDAAARPVRGHRRPGGGAPAHELEVTLEGVTRRYTCVQDGGTLWLARDGHAWAVREQEPLEAARHGEEGAGGPVRSPMPGTVTVVEVGEGQQVAAGERLAVVEAMKMEHVLTAPVAGVVRELRARAGATVERDAVLAVVEPLDAVPAAGAAPVADVPADTAAADTVATDTAATGPTTAGTPARS